MSSLPKFIRLAPKLFYLVAGVSLFFGILLPLVELRRWGYSTDLPVQDGFTKAIVFKHIVRQIADSTYLFANALFLDVLIRIWDKIGTSKAGEPA